MHYKLMKNHNASQNQLLVLLIPSLDATFIVAAVIIGVAAFICKGINNCFDDEDPDLDWYDNYAVINCPHEGSKSLKVVDSCVICETIHTICDDCGKVLNVNTDC